MDFLLPAADTIPNGQPHPVTSNWSFDTKFGMWKLNGSERVGCSGIFTDNPLRKMKVEIAQDESFVDTSKFFIREISSTVAKSMIVENHYSHSWTMCSVALGVFNRHPAKADSFFEGDDETLVGCIVFGNPVGRSAAASISDQIQINEVYELTRLWVADIPNCKNIESYVLGQSFEWLRKNRPHIKALLSYSDNEAGHCGVVYQSTNWIYQGNSQLALMPNYSVSLNNDPYDWIHSRTVMSRWGSHNVDHLKKVLGQTFWRKKESNKHRYIYILAKGSERKRILKNLKHKSYPYPKTTTFDEQIEECFVDKTTEAGVNTLDAFLV